MSAKSPLPRVWIGNGPERLLYDPEMRPRYPTLAERKQSERNYDRMMQSRLDRELQSEARKGSCSDYDPFSRDKLYGGGE